jgi:uncharacterized protein
MQLPPVKTPCIGVCSTGIGDSVCRGCKRFAHEVIHWNSYTEEQRRIIDARLAQFLSQCVANKLEVTDPALLQWQLSVQQIRYAPHHDAYCWVYALLKAGANQIKEPADYGIEIDLAYRAHPLGELRQLIDAEFFALSQAHYDRYMLTPGLFGAQSEA